MTDVNWREYVRQGLVLPHANCPFCVKSPVTEPSDPKFKLTDPPVMSSCVTTAAWLGVGSNQNTDATRRAITLPLIVLLELVFIMSILPCHPIGRPIGWHDHVVQCLLTGIPDVRQL